MSEILSNIVVEQTSINFSPDTNNLNITPEAIQLNIFTGAAPGAGYSNNGELLYNNTNLIDGVPNTSFASGNLSLGNISNVKITGGSLNAVLVTDGSGNLNFSTITNITSLGTLTGLTVNGTSNLGNVGNVKITGGINGYVLQTDGAGNLDWTAMSGGGGNGSPGGSNTQIQYNDNGLFGGASGFTFNEVSGDVAVPGNLTLGGTLLGNVSFAFNANYANFAGTVITAAQPNITSVGTLTGLNVNGNITAANITANTGVFTGNGSGLTAITGANVTGTVANATFATTAGSATTAGTVTTAAQPNITSVGTLTGLGVSGNITAANITANTGVFTGNASGLTNIPGANVSGQVANALIAGTVYTNAQPNITSIGTLIDLSVSGTTSIFEAIENVNLIGAQTGTYNYDVLDGAIQYSTANATANLTLNFRGNSTSTLDSVLANGKSTTVTYVMTTGATGYFVNAVQIDTSAQSIKWVNGIIPPLNTSSTTAYTFTLIKTSTTPTYTVLGSATRYA